MLWIVYLSGKNVFVGEIADVEFHVASDLAVNSVRRNDENFVFDIAGRSEQRRQSGRARHGVFLRIDEKVGID